MTLKSFLITFFYCCASTAAVLFLCSLTEALQPYMDLGWYAFAIFFFLTTGLFFIGKKVANHPDPTLFVSFSYLMIGFRMIVSIGLIMLYYNAVHPESKLFVLPFFIVYLFFTVHEVYVLTKTGA